MRFQRDGQKHAQRKANQRQGNKQLTFAGAVRQGGEEEHARNRPDVGQNGQHAYLADAGVRQLFENGRKPQGITVNPGLIKEVQCDQLPHSFVGQHCAKRRVFDLFPHDGLLLRGQRLDQIIFLGLRNPARLLRTVINSKRPQHQHYHRQQTFDDEQPAPVQYGDDPAGERRGDDPGNRHKHNHDSVSASALGIREPVADHRQHHR